MYAAIRTYKTSDAAEVSRRAGEGFVPIISSTPGFAGYYIVDGGDGTVASISVFQDEAGAEESTRRAAEWVAENMAELIEGAPTVLAGEVTVDTSQG